MKAHTRWQPNVPCYRERTLPFQRDESVPFKNTGVSGAPLAFIFRKESRLLTITRVENLDNNFSTTVEAQTCVHINSASMRLSKPRQRPHKTESYFPTDFTRLVSLLSYVNQKTVIVCVLELERPNPYSCVQMSSFAWAIALWGISMRRVWRAHAEGWFAKEDICWQPKVSYSMGKKPRKMSQRPSLPPKMCLGCLSQLLSGNKAGR